MNKYSLTLILALGLPLTGCMSVPADLDLSLSKSTHDHRYVVAMHPQDEAIVINRLHAWEVQVTSPAGAPVLQAQFKVDGGMPQHGHGLPTQPRVTRELGEGRYLLEGMKFSMTGWWEIRLTVQAPDGAADTVTFNKVIAEPTATRG